MDDKISIIWDKNAFLNILVITSFVNKLIFEWVIL
jgi:hypothetical protein